MKPVILTVIMLITFNCLQSIELNYDKVRNNLRGIKLYEEDNIEEAAKQFEKNVINNPGEGPLHFNLGNSYYRQKEYEKAINEYERALRDDNFANKSETWHNVGNSFFGQQQYQEALEMYRKAIITDPDNSDARYNYELTRLMLQQSQEENQQQSGDSDNENQQQEQQEQQSAEENEEQNSQEAQSNEEKDTDKDEEKDNNESNNQQELEEAENMLRTLLSREKELLEEERKKNRKESQLRGKFW